MLFATLGILMFVAPPNSTSTVCDRYKSADLIFTGSAEDKWMDMLDTHQSPVHRRKEKSRRVRFLVREWYKGQRQDLVETWVTPSNCPLKIEANQMYLIYARVNKDNGRTETNACMGTTLASGAAPDLTYLTAAAEGRATEITGMAAKEGVNIQAKSGINTRYATADAKGLFTLNGLLPGDWTLSVVGGAPQNINLQPDSCMTVDLSH
jgi:hypothetical protein